MTSDEERESLKLENPYLISLAKQKRLCPRCGKLTKLLPAMNPNGAVEKCSCGFIRAVHVPREFWIADNTGSYGGNNLKLV